MCCPYVRYLLSLTIAGLLVSLAVNVTQWRELQATHRAAQELTPHTIDVRFSQFMAVHHQQAIAMSQLMLDGRPTGLGALARRIASGQLMELGEMRGWLKLWGEPIQPDLDDMTWMLLGQQPYDEELLQYLIDCGNAPQGMPGLASTQQLQQLRALDGQDRDRLYLQLMLAHHEGGLPMARFAAREATLAPVRRLAGLILLEQAREIQQMRSMLAVVAHAAASNSDL